MPSEHIAKLYTDASAQNSAFFIDLPAKPYPKALYDMIPFNPPPKTTNEAEYRALIIGIRILYRYTISTKDYISIDAVEIMSDSQLMVNQINDVYKTTKRELIELRDQARMLLDQLFTKNNRPFTLTWIEREQNRAGHLLERNRRVRE